ncbi:MAG: hypothetical protein ACC653_01200 [Gammaproteobacteria bacterium]
MIGSVSGGFYSSVNNEFKVKTPPIPKLSVQDGMLNDRVFVDFYQSRGFWKKYGLYSIEWYQVDNKNSTDKNFYQLTKSTTSSFVKNNFGSRGSFTVVDTRKMKVNERSAFQFVADGMLDNIDAVWIGTTIKFDNNIALISIVMHSENVNKSGLHGATVQANIPWDKYNSFLHSFTKLK